VKDNLLNRLQRISLPIEARMTLALSFGVFAVLAASVLMIGRLPSPI
jgi:hypothetical protein